MKLVTLVKRVPAESAAVKMVVFEKMGLKFFCGIAKPLGRRHTDYIESRFTNAIM